MKSIQEQVWELLECLPDDSPLVGNDGQEHCPRLNGLPIWEEADRRVQESLRIPSDLQEKYKSAFDSLEWEEEVVIDSPAHWSNSFSHESDSWKREWVPKQTHTEYTPVLNGWELPYSPKMAWSKESSLGSLLLEVWNDLFGEEKEKIILATWEEWLELAQRESRFASKEERIKAEREAEKAARLRMAEEGKAKAPLPSGKPKPRKKVK